MKKPITIIEDELVYALTDRNIAWYLDLETGLLYPCNYEDALLEHFSPEEITESRFHYIEPLPSSESFEIMNQFVDQLEDDHPMKAVLGGVLHGKKPFWNFKNQLRNDEALRQDWFEFYAQVMHHKASAWLDTHKILGILVTSSEKYQSMDPLSSR